MRIYLSMVLSLKPTSVKEKFGLLIGFTVPHVEPQSLKYWSKHRDDAWYLIDQYALNLPIGLSATRQVSLNSRLDNQLIDKRIIVI